jgi:hypothetical protein
MQQLAHRHSQKIIDENQNLRSELESKISELNARSKQFDDLSEKSDYERRDLEQEKQKVCGLLASCISSFAPFLHLLNWSNPFFFFLRTALTTCPLCYHVHFYLSHT